MFLTLEAFSHVELPYRRPGLMAQEPPYDDDDAMSEIMDRNKLIFICIFDFSSKEINIAK